MATINKTIASSGGDYTSLSLFEASIPGSSADDFIATYTEAFSDTTRVVVSVASFTGSILVTVAEAYRCKGAVTGSHAELKSVTADNVDLLRISSTPNFTVEHLRMIRENGVAVVFQAITSNNVKVNSCTMVRRAASGAPLYFNDCTNVVFSENYCVITSFDLGTVTICAFYRAGAATSVKCYRNKFLYNAGAALAILACWGNANVDAQQNIVIIAAGTVTNGGYDTGFGGAWNATCDANVSSEAADCPGTNAKNSESAGNVFTTTVSGSENLSYPSRAKMQEQYAGSDLSAIVGATDIKGVTILQWYPGADFIAPPANNGRMGARLHMRLGL